MSEKNNVNITGPVNWDDVENKPGEFTPAHHTHGEYAKRYHKHSISDLGDMETIAGLHSHDSLYYRKSDVDNLVENISWDSIKTKPTQFNPAPHTHDEAYYKKAESDKMIADAKKDIKYIDLIGTPTTFKPEVHNHDDLYNTKEEVDTKITEAKTDIDYNDLKNIPTDFNPSTHNHDDSYHTRTEIDTIVKDVKNDYEQKIYDAKLEVDFNDLVNLPSSFKPEAHNHNNYYYTKLQVDEVVDEIYEAIGSGGGNPGGGTGGGGTGGGDDVDHSQFATKEDLIQKADLKHTHEIKEIKGLGDTLRRLEDLIEDIAGGTLPPPEGGGGGEGTLQSLREIINTLNDLGYYLSSSSTLDDVLVKLLDIKEDIMDTVSAVKQLNVPDVNFVSDKSLVEVITTLRTQVKSYLRELEKTLEDNKSIIDDYELITQELNNLGYTITDREPPRYVAQRLRTIRREISEVTAALLDLNIPDVTIDVNVARLPDIKNCISTQVKDAYQNLLDELFKNQTIINDYSKIPKELTAMGYALEDNAPPLAVTSQLKRITTDMTSVARAIQNLNMPGVTIDLTNMNAAKLQSFVEVEITNHLKDLYTQIQAFDAVMKDYNLITTALNDIGYETPQDTTPQVVSQTIYNIQKEMGDVADELLNLNVPGLSVDIRKPNLVEMKEVLHNQVATYLGELQKSDTDFKNYLKDYQKVTRALTNLGYEVDIDANPTIVSAKINSIKVELNDLILAINGLRIVDANGDFTSPNLSNSAVLKDITKVIVSNVKNTIDTLTKELKKQENYINNEFYAKATAIKDTINFIRLEDITITENTSITDGAEKTKDLLVKIDETIKNKWKREFENYDIITRDIAFAINGYGAPDVNITTQGSTHKKLLSDIRKVVQGDLFDYVQYLYNLALNGGGGGSELPPPPTIDKMIFEQNPEDDLNNDGKVDWDDLFLAITNLGHITVPAGSRSNDAIKVLNKDIKEYVTNLKTIIDQKTEDLRKANETILQLQDIQVNYKFIPRALKDMKYPIPEDAPPQDVAALIEIIGRDIESLCRSIRDLKVPNMYIPEDTHLKDMPNYVHQFVAKFIDGSAKEIAGLEKEIARLNVIIGDYNKIPQMLISMGYNILETASPTEVESVLLNITEEIESLGKSINDLGLTINKVDKDATLSNIIRFINTDLLEVTRTINDEMITLQDTIMELNDRLANYEATINSALIDIGYVIDVDSPTEKTVEKIQEIRSDMNDLVDNFNDLNLPSPKLDHSSIIPDMLPLFTQLKLIVDAAGEAVDPEELLKNILKSLGYDFEKHTYNEILEELKERLSVGRQSEIIENMNRIKSDLVQKFSALDGYIEIGEPSMGNLNTLIDFNHEAFLQGSKFNNTSTFVELVLSAAGFTVNFNDFEKDKFSIDDYITVEEECFRFHTKDILNNATVKENSDIVICDIPMVIKVADCKFNDYKGCEINIE